MNDKNLLKMITLLYCYSVMWFDIYYYIITLVLTRSPCPNKYDIQFYKKLMKTGWIKLCFIGDLAVEENKPICAKGIFMLQ